MEACGLGGNVVLQLCKSISSGHNYKTFADNYFSNFRMVEELIKQGFHYRNIVLVRWFDNKSVTLISSYVGLEPASQVQRYNKKIRIYPYQQAIHYQRIQRQYGRDRPS